MTPSSWLRIHGARQNNLKNVSLSLPHDRLTVVTGVSGSGKSSLAFDTLFAEGQWRFVESLTSYARMFLERIDRPDVDQVEHVRPAIALEQKNPVRTARSTVSTATELADYLRLLYAKIGRVHCPRCGREARADAPERAAEELVRRHPGRGRWSPSRCPSRPRSRPPSSWAGWSPGASPGSRSAATSFPSRRSRRSTWRPTRSCVSSSTAWCSTRAARPAWPARSSRRFADGGGRAVVEVLSADGSAATAVRYGERFGCHACDLTLERPQPLLFSFNHPLGACPECRGFGHLLRYDESRVVPDPSLSLADGAVQPWRHPSGEWYQKELLRTARRRKVDVHMPYRELPEEIRRWVQQGDDDFCGIRGFFEEVEGYRYKLHVRVFLSRYRSQAPCPSCRGARLKPEALAVTVGDRTIAEVGGFTVDELAAWLDGLPLSAWATEVARDVRTRLQGKSRSCGASAWDT